MDDHRQRYLEVVGNSRPSFQRRPAPGDKPAGYPFLTGILILDAGLEGRTKYSVRLLHKDLQGRKGHGEMGFREAWNQRLDRLVALVGQQGRSA